MREDSVSDMESLKTRIRRKRTIMMLAIILLCGALLVAYFQWGLDYLYLKAVTKPNTENQQLAFQIESARGELADIPNLVDEREQQLAHAQELLASELDKTPRELDINNIIRTILQIASRSGVTALPLTTTPPEYQVLNHYEYGHWHIAMSVTGKFQNLANFVNSLDGKDISNATVAQVVVNPCNENPEISSIRNNNVFVSSNLEFLVYVISGDHDETFR